METTLEKCACCGREFLPRLSFQRVVAAGITTFYCSQTCRNPALRGDAVQCSVCGKAFLPTLAIHVADSSEGRRFYCSEACRAARNASLWPSPTATAERWHRSWWPS